VPLEILYESIPCNGWAVKRRSWSANNAFQDLLDLTAKKDVICNRTALGMISIHLQFRINEIHIGRYPSQLVLHGILLYNIYTEI
jgi:hypothetical protein